MIQECSAGELLTKAAFKHHDNKGNDALKHYAVLKGFLTSLFVCFDESLSLLTL